MADQGEGSRKARGTSGQRPDAGLARDLSELARNMQAESSMDALAQRITESAVAEVQGAEDAGISEITKTKIVTRAATSGVVERIDQIQYRTGDGPCLPSLREQVTIRSDDLTAESRWPLFCPGAVQEGIRTMLSVQLFVDGDNMGALNLYATEPNAFRDEDESTAMLLASHAALAMKGSRVETNLRTALQSRDVIGQAKGILMERYRVDDTQAFDLLVMASQRTNRKLTVIADELANTGELKID